MKKHQEIYFKEWVYWDGKDETRYYASFEKAKGLTKLFNLIFDLPDKLLKGWWES